MNARNETRNPSRMDDQVRQIHEAWRTQSNLMALKPYNPTPEDEAAYTSWAAKNEATRQIEYDRWLDSPEGQAWLDGESERYVLEYGVGSAGTSYEYH